MLDFLLHSVDQVVTGFNKWLFHLTAWKVVGYIGVLMFGGRWLVQAWASKNKGRVTMPRLFWYMSIAGSLMVLSYFIFGKNDSVGILSNALPFTVALYNLYLDIKNHGFSGKKADVMEELVETTNLDLPLPELDVESERPRDRSNTQRLETVAG